MGNYRFKLSDMIPNAWFYKLRDMNKMKTTTTTTTNHHKKPPSITTQNNHFSQPRNSFNYTPKVSQFHNNNNNSPKFPHFHDPPRKSSKKPKPNRKTIYKPSPKHTYSPTEFTESTHTLQEFFHSPTTNTTSPSSESTQSCKCRLSSSTSDIIIDVNNTTKKSYISSDFDNLKLARIITKPSNPKPSLSSKNIIKESNQTPARKSISGIKIRPNSPKLAVSKRIVRKSTQRKNLSESLAVVKTSFDPKKDFMESMMEMIVENNIKSSKDLEELLACYLSLNSDEYHDVIVKAFEQIWFSLPNL